MKLPNGASSVKKIPIIPHPRIQRHKQIGEQKSVSSYSRDYDAQKYDAVWPVKFRNQSGPPGPTTGYKGTTQVMH